MTDEATPRGAIYLDNAATSWPKPRAVVDAVRDFMLHIGANPGRSGHRLSASAARVVFDTREALARLLGIPDSRQLIFTPNATFALNLALSGLIRPGGHAVTTSMEHNSVMRPLRALARARGAEVTVVKSDAQGRADVAGIAAAVRPETDAVVVNHASNVVGSIAPVVKIKAAIGDTPLLVDAAQTAGALPIDVGGDGIDLLACTGHKSLLGPTGTGCLYIRPGLAERIAPLLAGGTGSNSEHEEQPRTLPDRYESGTLDAAGLAGLGAGVLYLAKRGVDSVRAHELELIALLLDGLRRIAGVREYGPEDAAERTATLSISIDGMVPSEVGLRLDREHNVLVRCGLHCAPAAHRTLGTFPQGTVRLGLGALTTRDEVEAALAALGSLAAEGRA